MISTTQPAINKYLSADLAFLTAQNLNKPTDQPEKLISKSINGNRVMPPESPFPGVYDIYKTPYIIELCDNMSPFSACTGQAIKKGVQIAITTAVENCIAYYWKVRPSAQMYLTGTEALILDFETERLVPLMASAGLVSSITVYKKGSRKTGDTTRRKDYRGGFLVMGSIQSSADARSKSIPIMYVDEIDLASVQMHTGEGNRLEVLAGRLTAFEGRSKMMSLSTPRERHNSLIDIQYDQGDKRKFMVPCPHCKKQQWLCLGDDNTNYGLKGDYKAGVLEQGYYICYHCHDAIFNGNKGFMLSLANGAHWEPTCTPTIKNYRSYHIPSFYSPMMSFTAMRQKYDIAIDAGDDGMRSFTNLYLGKSFYPSGQKPKYETVIEIRSKDQNYISGVVPANIMFLTAFCDVQAGKNKFKDMTTDQILTHQARVFAKDEVSPELRTMPRLEVEVCGHGAQFRTASVIYKTFWGRVDRQDAGAWAQLTEWIEETNLTFKRRDGFKFPVQMFFIDSGYQTDLVYQFAEPLGRTYASKGDKTRTEDKLKLFEIDSPQAGGNVRRFNVSKSGSYTVITINTNYYKTHIYRILDKRYEHGAEQPPDTHITPTDYPDWYYKGLTAEEHRADGTFHNKSGARNEPLDLLVGHKSAADYFLEGMIEADRFTICDRYKKARKAKPSKEKLRELVNRSSVTANLITGLKKRGW